MAEDDFLQQCGALEALFQTMRQAPIAAVLAVSESPAAPASTLFKGPPPAKIRPIMVPPASVQPQAEDELRPQKKNQAVAAKAQIVQNLPPAQLEVPKVVAKAQIVLTPPAQLEASASAGPGAFPPPPPPPPLAPPHPVAPPPVAPWRRQCADTPGSSSSSQAHGEAATEADWSRCQNCWQKLSGDEWWYVCDAWGVPRVKERRPGESTRMRGASGGRHITPNWCQAKNEAILLGDLDGLLARNKKPRNRFADEFFVPRWS